MEKSNENNKLELNIKVNSSNNNNHNKNKPNILQQLNFLSSFSTKEEKNRINSPSNSIIISNKEKEINRKEISNNNNKDNSVLS